MGAAEMIEFILAIIPLEWLLGLAALVGTLAAVWVSGKRSGTDKAKQAAEKRNIKTREAMDNVENGNDPDAARRWLRERGE